MLVNRSGYKGCGFVYYGSFYRGLSRRRAAAIALNPSPSIRLHLRLLKSTIALNTKSTIAFPPSTSIGVHLRLLKRAIGLTTKSAIALHP
ncbi:hypothetical protein QUA30_04985 [Microcoleus sp. Pol14C2]|uniref:hypothetical protein n=1 Tax=unclassified Microcoleus TaxID=2642155 RepID=UPI002FCF6732